MAGCEGSSCGIGKQRDRELDRVRAAMVGHPEEAVSHPEITRLGTLFEQLLPVRAFLRKASVPDECDWLYLLVGVHDRSLMEEGEPARDQETYVRLGFSPLGRFVTLQECRLTLDRRAGILEEAPRVGVEDRRLQGIVKGLQGALRKARLIVVDAAFLCAGDAWSQLFQTGQPGDLRFTSTSY